MRQEGRSKGRGRAILAGGLVFGLGAAMTLATWTDHAFVNGLFDTGDKIAQFEANVSSDDFEDDEWSDYHTTPGGDLAFTVATGDGLSPGETIYAPVSLRAKQNSLGFKVTLNGATQGEAYSDGQESLWDLLQYRVVTTEEPDTCGAAAFGGSPTYIVGSGGYVDIDTASAADAITLAAGDADDPGTAVNLCFAVQLNATQAALATTTPAVQAEFEAAQGQEVQAIWKFTGSSDES